jgi:hypothetical protein
MLPTHIGTRQSLSLSGQYENPNRIPPTFFADHLQTKDKLPALDTETDRFLPKQLKKGEITWYMGMMELPKQGSNGMGALGGRG